MCGTGFSRVLGIWNTLPAVVVGADTTVMFERLIERRMGRLGTEGYGSSAAREISLNVQHGHCSVLTVLCSNRLQSHRVLQHGNRPFSSTSPCLPRCSIYTSPVFGPYPSPPLLSMYLSKCPLIVYIVPASTNSLAAGSI